MMENVNATTSESGAPFGSEEAENLIAERLRTLRDRGLPADREAVADALLNEGEISLWEKTTPVEQGARRGTPRLSGSGEDPFEAAVRQLVDRGYSREDAVAKLANTGAVPW